MKFKTKFIFAMFFWGFVMLMGSYANLNENPVFAVLTVVLSFTLVFGGKKIYTKLNQKRSRPE